MGPVDVHVAGAASIEFLGAPGPPRATAFQAT
jgi:hypothetical protein